MLWQNTSVKLLKRGFPLAHGLRQSVSCRTETRGKWLHCLHSRGSENDGCWSSVGFSFVSFYSLWHPSPWLVQQTLRYSQGESPLLSWTSLETPHRETQSCVSLVIPNAARFAIKINSLMANILGASFIDHRGMKLSTLCWGSFATMCRKYLVLIHSAPWQGEGQWGCCWGLRSSTAFCLPGLLEDPYSSVCLSTHNLFS